MAKRVIVNPANIAYKFRIYPTKKQIEIIDANFRARNDIFNHFLGLQQQYDIQAQIMFLEEIYGVGTITYDKLKITDRYKQHLYNGAPLILNKEQIVNMKLFVKKYKTENKLWFNKFSAYKDFSQLKIDNPIRYEYFKKVSSSVVVPSAETLGKAFENIKKTHAGYPKFKSFYDNKKSYSSQIQYIDNKIKGFSLTLKNSLYAQSGEFKKARCYMSLPSAQSNDFKLRNVEIIIQQEEFLLYWDKLENLILKSFTVSKNSVDEYFISISCHSKRKAIVVDKKLEDFMTSIGIDCNNGHITTEDVLLNINKSFNRGNVFSKHIDKINTLNKQISNKIGNQKGEKRSNGYLRLRKKINNIHVKLTNIRKYNNDVVSKQLVESSFDTIVFEDLSIKNMIKRTINQTERKNQNTKRKRSQRRNSLDMGWNDLMIKTENKAKILGKNVVKVNPYHTSKRCGVCGEINKNLTLSDRTWTCTCGAIHDRDLNAAKNIKEKYYNVW